MSDLLILDGPDVTHGPAAPSVFAERLTGEGGGRALVAFADPENHRLNLELSLGLLSSLGPVLSVYPKDGCWSDLGVRTNVEPGRTHGVGENRLHVDLVDRDATPRYIALYCVRNDPLGGGASALSDLWAAAGELTDADQDLLSKPWFTYWTDGGVHGVGNSLARFAVLPEQLDATPIRFTSKMLPHLKKGDLVGTDRDRIPFIAAAFNNLVEAAYAHRATARLAPGQLLVWDQWRYAHGRMPLGPYQETVPPDERRLLKQSYVRDAQCGGGL